jgi:isopenicillin-N N-acyltransferase-like protein
VSKPSKLHLVKCQGTYREIGLQHGRQLRERIRQTANFYNQVLFKGQFDLIEEQGNLYLAKIDQFNPGFGEEIRAIAEGANQPIWQIAALNARTEIYQRVDASTKTECTSAFFPESRLLGQNWDWMEPLEDLIVVMEITHSDGHKIMQLTEPGIIGKIGLNSKGIGVCLNILNGGANPATVPVHVLLRAALECKTLDEFRDILGQTKMGTWSNILAADAHNEFLDVEICGDHIRYVDYQHAPIVHTNHFLGPYSQQTNEATDEKYASSRARYAKGSHLYTRVESRLEEFKTMLANEEDAPLEICRQYRPVEGNIVGTAASIIMDLANLDMHISIGRCSEYPWQCLSIA